MSCGKTEDDDQQNEMPARREPARSGKCVKCRTKDIEFAKLAAGYCKECFVIALGKRFKDVVFPAREHCRAPKGSKDKTNASILLAYSGSASSRTTLEYFKSLYFSDEQDNSRTQPAFKAIEILYVRTSRDADAIVEEHRQTVAEYGWNLTVLHLDQAFEASSKSIDVSSPDLHVSESSNDATTLLEGAGFTATSQETVSSTVLQAFIIEYAKTKNHKAIFFCDTATKLAAKTLGAISKGQGWNLGELVSGADIPVVDSDLRVYRPLSNVSDEEVRFFVGTVKNWELAAGTSTKAGIDGLVENFIKNLEAGFPSTVSIISRTASKLGLRSLEKSESTSYCALCRLPRDPKTLAWRPVASLSAFEELDHTIQKITNEGASESSAFASKLCYGCLVPFLELQGPAKKTKAPSVDPASTLHRLPIYTINALDGLNSNCTTLNNQPEEGSAHLRAEIQEFLL